MSHLAETTATTNESPARPPVSEARAAANRRNAAKSTGPRTAEGKARSRANALKHGLAGAGICLPSEDAALVQERCLQLHEEMAPTTLRGMMLVEVAALAHTRIKRAARQEVAALSYRQRQAVAEFDDARLTDAEDELRQIDHRTPTRHRRLLSTPEGVDLVIARLALIRREVRNPEIRWNYIHGNHLENLCGRRGDDPLIPSRGWALSLALEFDGSRLTAADRLAIGSDDATAIREWAKPQMEALIDTEVALLQAHRATLDLATHARERAEAPERAMFDAGRDAALARRYEAAATRTFFRALREFDAIERSLARADLASGLAATPTEAGHDPAAPSALDPPSRATAEVLAEGDGVVIVDPADRAEPPPPAPRAPIPLASFGITAEEASREISHPHYSLAPRPFDQPPPVYNPKTGRWQ